MTLAQTTYAEQAGSGLMEILDSLLHLNMPTREEFITSLETLTTLQAAVVVALGIWYLFYGHKYFKAMVVINGAGAGALIGMYISQTLFTDGSPNTPMLMALGGAALLGALAWPMLKYAVGIMGALAGGLVGYAGWHLIATAIGNEAMRQHAWTGGVIGMVVVGMIAFVVFRASVMIFTGLQGSLMTVGGTISLLLAHSATNDSIRPAIVGNDLLLIIILGVPAVIGFAAQYATDAAAIRKKRKATEKPPV